MSKNKNIIIVGGGLAGCEAAWQIANLGLEVHLYEMRLDFNHTLLTINFITPYILLPDV